MIFNSVTYLLFLAAVVTLWWFLPRRARLWLIFVASLTFYSFWRIEFLPVMLASTVTDYFAAIAIEKTPDRARKKKWLYLSLTVNLGLLIYFKYLLFFAESVSGMMRLFGVEFDIPAMNLILPLGISFYTFQTISYTVDVYRGFIKPERDFVLYADYVIFFPQLVAGPILRAREVIYQISERRPFELTHIAIGIRRVMYGLFLKVVLADHVGYWVDMGYSQPSEFISALDVWTLGFMFGFQVYFDFSAYSHIAIGSARMMGVKLPENFNFPLIATSPRDLWGRWHISLSSWIRDYMYLPLAGLPVQDRSTGGLAGATTVDQPTTARRNFALFTTWGLMGLWHGAAWTTVAWGLIHAVYVYLYRIIQPWFGWLPEVVRRFGGWVITLGVFMFALVPFRSQSIPQMFTMVGHVFNPTKYFKLGLVEDTYVLAALLLVGCTGAYWIHKLVLPGLRRHRYLWLAVETVAFCLIIVTVFIFLRPIRQFIYFEF